MKVPEIRFKGFGREWEDKELDELLSFKNGINASKEQYGKGLKFINVLDIINNQFITHSNIIGLVDVSDDVFEKNKVEYGDILFQRSSETREEVGQSNVYLDKEKNSTFGGFVIRGKKSGDYNPVFMNFLLKNRSVRKEITTRSGGSTRYNVGQEILKRVPINIPFEPEQAQIGNIFQKLDSLINQHQQKHDKLSNIKKSMLEKMFPKQGETTPEIRFKGFSGDWEVRSLSEEAVVSTGFPFDSSDFFDSGNLLVITNGNIQNSSAAVNGKVGNRIAIEKVDLLNQYALNIGDILVTMDGSVGRTAKVIEPNQILAQRVGRLVAKNNTEFLYQSLNTGAFLDSMTTISHGGTIKHISLSEIGSYMLLVPGNLEEQEKIGNYLKNLDALTQQHQEQITKLNNVKQACLSKMFV